MIQADLLGTIPKADLHQADLGEADLREADLEEANIEDATLGRLAWRGSILCVGWSIETSWVQERIAQVCQGKGLNEAVGRIAADVECLLGVILSSLIVTPVMAALARRTRYDSGGLPMPPIVVRV